MPRERKAKHKGNLRLTSPPFFFLLEMLFMSTSRPRHPVGAPEQRGRTAAGTVSARPSLGARATGKRSQNEGGACELSAATQLPRARVPGMHILCAL